MRLAQRRAAALTLGEVIMWSLTGLVVAVGFAIVLVLVLRALVTGRVRGTHPRVLAPPYAPAQRLRQSTGGFLE